MAGGKASPKKDKSMKVSGGKFVKTGTMLMRGSNTYKVGKNVQGQEIMHALCDGKVYFTRKKTSHGRMRTFINIEPIKEVVKK